jgi:hypothetical protein
LISKGVEVDPFDIEKYSVVQDDTKKPTGFAKNVKINH